MTPSLRVVEATLPLDVSFQNHIPSRRQFPSHASPARPPNPLRSLRELQSQSVRMTGVQRLRR